MSREFWDPIVRDIAERFQRFGSISPKQVALVRKLADQVRNPAPPEAHVPAPTGRVTFRGEVVSIKSHESQFGTSLKMVVKVQAEGGTWLAWGTVPSNLDPFRGDIVELTATLTQGRDPHFAFYKRPSKASVVKSGGGGGTCEGTLRDVPHFS